jgi:hypothetical protein
MAPACQEKNLKGLTMVAIGVNKSADQYLILDEQTQDEIASGKFHDQRRGSFGNSAPSPRHAEADRPAASSGVKVGDAAKPGGRQPSAQQRRAQRRPAQAATTRHRWSPSQQRLAVLYNEQGLRPEEIARKLGLDAYTVTQIILASTNRGKL